MKKPKSVRLEFDEGEKKLIRKAAKLDGRSAKKFMEIAVRAATLQKLNSHEKL